MSTTPRTDAERHDWSEDAGMIPCSGGDWTPAEFARTLELENRELRERLAERLERQLFLVGRFPASTECKELKERIAHLRDFATPLDVSKL